MPEQEGSREKGVGGREWGVGGDPNPIPHSPLPTAHSPEKSPGQTAYAAYWHALAPAHGGMPLAPFAAMGAMHQAAWDAAAQAVRALTHQEETTTMPDTPTPTHTRPRCPHCGATMAQLGLSIDEAKRTGLFFCPDCGKVLGAQLLPEGIRDADA